jgi:hypothetical protein
MLWTGTGGDKKESAGFATGAPLHVVRKAYGIKTVSTT